VKTLHGLDRLPGPECFPIASTQGHPGVGRSWFSVALSGPFGVCNVDVKRPDEAVAKMLPEILVTQ
jgi:hypothetical protein